MKPECKRAAALRAALQDVVHACEVMKQDIEDETSHVECVVCGGQDGAHDAKGCPGYIAQDALIATDSSGCL